MPFQKFTTLQLKNATPYIPTGLEKTAKLSDFEFTPQPGFLYVATRAISSRVNANYDGWPPEELRNAYRSFVGKPVFVDHNNWDLSRTRGVIIDSQLYESKLGSGTEDVWVQLLIEVDANAFPKLAQAIVDGDVDAVSMGADVEYTVCSICKKAARNTIEYCQHIPQMKGQFFDVMDKKTGSKIRKLCYEQCYGVSFFEISFVFDPADESALITDKMLYTANADNRSIERVRMPKEKISAYGSRLGISKVARIVESDKFVMALPQEVDTLRDEMDCPLCDSPWDGMYCTACGFKLPPEGLGDPDTDPFGLNMPVGQPEDEEEGDQQDEEEDSEDEEESDESAEESEEESEEEEAEEEEDDESDEDEETPEDKAKKKKKSSIQDIDMEVLRVSRFNDLQKQAWLPQSPPYRQDTAPADEAGGQPESFEPALEPAPAAQAVVQDLDAPDVAITGPSQVSVVNEQPGPTDIAPPGSQVADSYSGGGLSQAEAPSDEETEKAAKREAYKRRRAAAIERRRQKQAEMVSVTDVRNLDEPPAVNVGPDTTVNVLAPTFEQPQLERAGTPPIINDGSETGLPSVRERLPQQFNPFNDASVPLPSEAIAPATASASKCEAGCECPDGSCNCGSCALSKTSSEIRAEVEAEMAEKIAAAKTRVLKISNFVDERIELGLTDPRYKQADYAKFENMDDATLEGYVLATREFVAKVGQSDNGRVRVAQTQSEFRLPSLGESTKTASEDDTEEAIDDLWLLPQVNE